MCAKLTETKKKKILANEFVHNIFRDILINEETRKEVAKRAKRHKPTALLSKWNIIRAEPEVRVDYNYIKEKKGRYSQFYQNTGYNHGNPSGKIDAVWFLERKNDTTRRRALCHEVKSGHFDLDEIMKYENQSSILYDLAILPGHDTENPLWVWAWNNEIEKAKTRAAPETLEKVGEGIIRLNPLEIIEDLYRVVRGWL